MQVKKMVGHYILVFNLSSVRECLAFLNTKTSVAFCVAV